MIETERLLIRKIGQEDIDLIFGLNSVPECTYLNGWTSIPMEICKDMIDKWIEQYKDTNGMGTFCVEDKESKYKIGMAYLLNYTELNQFLIGFRIRKACWNRDYEEEITRGFIKHAESNLDVDAIVAKVQQSDTRLRKVFEKLRFELSASPDNEYDVLYKYLLEREM